MKHPQSLLEATRLFSNPDKAHDYLAKLRWPDGIVPCPDCGCTENYYLKTVKRWKCKACSKQFSVKVGTIFESSPIGLDKWLIAVWLITNAKNGISSCELARSLEVTQKTAWFMLHRIRLALQAGTIEKLSGHLEADETYIGGKMSNKHQHKRTGIRGPAGKTMVMGLLKRGGKVHLQVADKADRKTVNRFILPRVDGFSTIYTDSHKGYDDLRFYHHRYAVDHAVEYVRGNVHTNCMENFWSLLKRTIKGTYVSVEPFHLFRYLDEQAFRYNNRKDNDGGRFIEALTGIQKRLTYKVLTGKEYAAA